MTCDPNTTPRATGPGWELRCGRYQDALADVVCEALLVDAPYSDRTHAKQRHGRREGAQWVAAEERWASSRGLGYEHWTPEIVDEFVDSWSPRVSGWMVSITDSELYPAWRDAMRRNGRYVFAPLPAVQRGMNCRLAGDGPSSWTTWVTIGVVVVSRTGEQRKWGTLRGAYEGDEAVAAETAAALSGAYVGNPFDAGENTATSSRRSGVVGSKPLWLMRELIRDYTRPGDLVVDPCSGGGTTLLAAVMEGRRAIGAELDPRHFDIARKRLERGFTVPMFAESAGSVAVQQSLLGDDE